MKTQQEIEDVLGLNGNETLEQLLNKFEAYITVTDAELNNMKNISVQTLPTIVRNQESLVKGRMLNPTVSDSQGMSAVLNKRIVLLKLIINALLSKTIADLRQHTDNQNNPHNVTKTQLGLENVINTGDSATPVENGTTKFTTGGAYTELNKKLNKDTSNASSVYGVSTPGTQVMYGVGQGASANKIVQRTSTGQVNLPETPTADEHATSKKYVDTNVNDTNIEVAKKQNKTLTTPLTIAQSTATTVETALAKLLDYIENLDQIVSAIQGSGDTSLANTLAGLRSDINSISTAWTEFMTGTSADNVLNTLSEIRTALEGKQPTIDSSHKLYADYVDDSNTGNKFIKVINTQTIDISTITKVGVYLLTYNGIKKIKYNPASNSTLDIYASMLTVTYLNNNLYNWHIFPEDAEDDFIYTGKTVNQQDVKTGNYQKNRLSDRVLNPIEELKSQTGYSNEYETEVDLRNGDMSFKITRGDFANGLGEGIYLDYNYVDEENGEDKYTELLIGIGFTAKNDSYWSEGEFESHSEFYFGASSHGDFVFTRTGNVNEEGGVNDEIHLIRDMKKSLYHLGAFDSADGKTRQSWVVDLGSLNWINGAGYKYCELPNAKKQDNFSFKCDNPNYTKVIRTQITTTSESIACGDIGGGKYGVYVNSSSYPNGRIVYETETSYTDTPIENESILPLDSNMAQMIRQDVVESLNLYPYEEPLYNNGTQEQAKVFNLKPNTTYCLSFTVSGNCRISITVGEGGTESVTYGSANRIFTTTSDGYVRIKFLYSAYNTAVTFTNIMLNEGSHAYPPSDYHASKHITDDEATLLKQEEEKCRNLWGNATSILNITANNSSGTYFSYNNEETLYIKIKAGTYTIKGNIGYATYSTSVPSVGVSYTKIGNIDNGVTFTCSTDVYFAISHSLNDVLSNIMLNKGSEAEPYQEWNGEIVHKTDIEPVLLWSNSSPTSDFAGTTLHNLPNMSNYKYIVVGYKLEKSSNSGTQYIKFKYEIARKYIGVIDETSKNYFRQFDIVSSTSLTISDGTYNNTTNNGILVPTEIYGTNIL